MTALTHARQILDSMLGYLGFIAKVDEVEGPEGPTLQVHTEDSKLLIGRHGATMEDIQYLVNRILQKHLPDAPRIRVDIGYFRSMKEDKIVEHAREMGERVRSTGQSQMLDPMNSYYRRMVHNAFADDPDVMSVSVESGSDRFKRILLKRRG
ncbi:MAG TPA: single-stranded DNA-binding protein [Verrucomicrobiales bacterium]|nr:single-stranded DNA-binding protein [Verrucomicrobiales bacterium]HCN78995.1 single-stranded DNA-binding protein [Verrucomicrobiales bacterium]HRJ09099.1 R3H domain-containing nucleic acid-binding protein [Prosthecobacter sp.]HRK14633.1 R3H domain-containing nucleic acid-binding protein [Prosthecobacter sp.]